MKQDAGATEVKGALLWCLALVCLVCWVDSVVCMRMMHDLVGDMELLQSDRGGERGLKGRMWTRCKGDGDGPGSLED